MRLAESVLPLKIWQRHSREPLPNLFTHRVRQAPVAIKKDYNKIPLCSPTTRV
jgi:hypothetical protein